MPNVPQLTVNAALIADTGVPSTLCDGENHGAQFLNISGGNSAFKFGTHLYSVVFDSNGHARVYQSDSTGAVWVTFGLQTNMTAHGGNTCAVLSGSTLVIGYSGQSQTNDGYFRTFDLLTQTWGAEGHFNTNTLSGGTIDFWEGPYYVFVRPDLSIVFIGNQTTAQNVPVAVVIAGNVATAAVAFPANGAGHGAFVLDAMMDTDGTIHVFSQVFVGGTIGQHQIFHLNNTATVEVAIVGIPQVTDYNGNGIEQGLLDSGTFYLAAGKQTLAFPNGRPVIVYGNDGAWNMTPELDTALDADFAVWDGNLFLQGAFFVAVFRLIHVSTGSNELVHRWGYVAKADFANPAKWVWANAYDFAAPVPIVDGVGPYNTVSFAGMNTGVVLGSDNIIRFCTTASGAKQFTTLLFSIAFPSAASTPTHFPYIDAIGVPAIPIMFRVASPSGMIWRQVCDPDEHPTKEETECSQ